MIKLESYRRKLSELSPEEIDIIVSFLQEQFCTIFHEVDFNIIASEVFGSEFSYNLVYDGAGRLVALCPLHTFKKGLVRNTYSSLAMYDLRYGGWVYDSDYTTIPELMKQIILSYNEKLTYWSMPQIKNNDYSHVNHKIEFNTPIIDLSLPIDDIFHQTLSRKRRQTINSAVRKGVVVEELQLANLDIFIQQCSSLKKSVGFSPLPAELFLRLYGRFSAENKVRFLISRVDDLILASGVIVANAAIAHLWIAGKPIDLQTNIPRQDLLVWESIKWAKQLGCEYYDMCYVDVERQQEIARHKLGFTKIIVPFYCINRKSFFARVVSHLPKST